jgi:hypothetical protein
MAVLNGAKDDELGLLFSRVRVWKAEPDLMAGVVVYSGTSAMFRQVQKGERPPWYRFIFTKAKGGKITMVVEVAGQPVDEVVLPTRYGGGVVYVPEGMRLVYAETGEELFHG